MIEIMSSEYDETYDSVISNVKSDANQGDTPFNIPVCINQESGLALPHVEISENPAYSITAALPHIETSENPAYSITAPHKEESKKNQCKWNSVWIVISVNILLLLAVGAIAMAALVQVSKMKSKNSIIGRNSGNPATSCLFILLLNPYFPSGHYWIRSSNGSAVRVYCEFNRKCGCDGPSGWTRVAFLNMSDPNQVCPRNWTTIPTLVKTCGRVRKNETNCDSVFYSTFGLTYSRVCGRIIAYQNGNTDAFKGLVFYSGIDQPYVDGVSLTHGSVGSRQHIWSFASAIGEEGPFQTYWLCACSNSNNWTNSTLFVGKDYFCDSGNHLKKIPSIFHSDDPLWDGQGCGSDSTCCQFNKPPWFCKTLTQSTTDDLEVRICNHGNSDDTPVQLLELYVQ